LTRRRPWRRRRRCLSSLIFISSPQCKSHQVVTNHEGFVNFLSHIFSLSQSHQNSCFCLAAKQNQKFVFFGDMPNKWTTSTISHFSDLFIQTKNKLHRSIYHVEFGKNAKFHKNPLQWKYGTPNLPMFS